MMQIVLYYLSLYHIHKNDIVSAYKACKIASTIKNPVNFVLFVKKFSLIHDFSWTRIIKNQCCGSAFNFCDLDPAVFLNLDPDPVA